MELFAKMRQWRKNLLSVKTPSLAFYSAWDEFLSRKNKTMLEANPAFTMVELQNSAHCYYEEPDLLLLKDKLVEFIA